MSDSARKRTLADWVVKTKKQVVKLYAVVKWSRDADTVQKCMVYIGRMYCCLKTQLEYLEYHCFPYEPESAIRRNHAWSNLCQRKP
jgi:hypothetical protein